MKIIDFTKRICPLQNFFFFFVLHLNQRIYLIGLKSSSELESPQIYSKPTENMEICMNHQIILMFSLIVQ